MNNLNNRFQTQHPESEMPPLPSGPSKLFIYIGIMMIVAGLVIPGYVAYIQISKMVEMFTENQPEELMVDVAGNLSDGIHLEIPGEVQTDVPEAGTYTVYHETNVNSRSQNLPDYTLSIISAETGQKIDVRGMSYSETYNMGQRSGYAVGKFDITVPGKYTISASTTEPVDSSNPPTLYISKSVVGHIFGEIGSTLLAAVIGVCCIVAGIITISVTASKRKKARETLTESSWQPPPI